MMNKTYKKLCTLLLALALLLAGAAALAEDASVTYEGGAEKFVFLPGSDYTSSDLFDNFKNVMPGDTRTQTILVKNEYNGADHVRIYLRAEVHEESGNNPKPSQEPAGEPGASMQEFLSQLSMKVHNGSQLIFSASADELDGLSSNVLLGSFNFGESTTLTVTLEVPLALDSKYANLVGEVDWVFTAEEYLEPEPTPTPTPHPSSTPVSPGPSPTVRLTGPQTGDDANILLWVGLLLAGVAGILLALFLGRKKRGRGN